MPPNLRPETSFLDFIIFFYGVMCSCEPRFPECWVLPRWSYSSLEVTWCEAKNSVSLKSQPWALTATERGTDLKCSLDLLQFLIQCKCNVSSCYIVYGLLTRKEAFSMDMGFLKVVFWCNCRLNFWMWGLSSWFWRWWNCGAGGPTIVSVRWILYPLSLVKIPNQGWKNAFLVNLTLSATINIIWVPIRIFTCFENSRQWCSSIDRYEI